MTETVRESLIVPLAPERAFALFAEQLGTWWPREYTWAQPVLEEIGMEPREGGLCFERGPHGFRCDWGRVLAWDPPERVAFSWQIAPDRTPVPDPGKASEVEVVFTPEGDGTRVELEHREFQRHGRGADDYRRALGSAKGWRYMLECYAGKAEG